MNIIFSTIITQARSSNHNNHQVHQAHEQTWVFLETYNVTRPTQLCVVPNFFHLRGRRPDAYKHIISPRIRNSAASNNNGDERQQQHVWTRTRQQQFILHVISQAHTNYIPIHAHTNNSPPIGCKRFHQQHICTQHI